MFSQGDSINIRDWWHKSFCHSTPLGRSNRGQLLDVTDSVCVLN